MFARPAVILLLLSMFASGAAAMTGVDSGPRDVPPGDAQRLGLLCRADSATARLWWSELPGGIGTIIEGGDGRCATVPPLVQQLAASAERARLRARTLGFPAMRGDAPPPVLRNPTLARALLRQSPPLRTRTLLGLTSRTRGAFLAGMTAAARRRVLRGTTLRVRRRLLRDMTAARRGRPSDFVGGDRRVDIVVDPSGATGRVNDSRPAAALCSLGRTGGRKPRRAFAHSYVVVLARGGTAPTAALAHELFHVVQCNMAVNASGPALLLEGTAEWFAAAADPAGFVTAPVTDVSGGTALSGGSSRVAAFCSAFDPADTSGLDAYNSWGVWAALAAGAEPASGVRTVLQWFSGRTNRRSPDDLIGLIGADRWTGALSTATTGLCGELRAPYTGLAFPGEVRSFFGAGRPSVSMGAGTTTIVPAWGTASVIARWGTASGARVTISAPGISPATLAAATVAMTPSGPLAVVERGAGVEVDVPTDTTEQAMLVVIASPSSAPVAVDVRVSPAAVG